MEVFYGVRVTELWMRQMPRKGSFWKIVAKGKEPNREGTQVKIRKVD